MTPHQGEAQERDPRVTPKAGDVLRIGGVYGGFWIEVLPADPRLASTDVPYVLDGVEKAKSLDQWRSAMYGAEVIRR